MFYFNFESTKVFTAPPPSFLHDIRGWNYYSSTPKTERTYRIQWRNMTSSFICEKVIFAKMCQFKSDGPTGSNGAT